jgi:hypothetical protein
MSDNDIACLLLGDERFLLVTSKPDMIRSFFPPETAIQRVGSVGEILRDAATEASYQDVTGDEMGRTVLQLEDGDSLTCLVLMSSYDELALFLEDLVLDGVNVEEVFDDTCFDGTGIGNELRREYSELLAWQGIEPTGGE